MLTGQKRESLKTGMWDLDNDINVCNKFLERSFTGCPGRDYHLEHSEGVYWVELTAQGIR